jgi:hypothetical protein
MAITVKKVDLWRKVVENKAGSLAEILAPLAKLGSDLQVVVGYGDAADPGKATVEVFPVKGRQGSKAAKEAGLAASSAAALMVEGDNRPGLGHAIASKIAEAGINIAFLSAQGLGKKFVAVFGFQNAGDANKARALIKKAAVPAKKPAARKPAVAKKPAAAKKAGAAKKAPAAKKLAARKPVAKVASAKPAAAKPAARKPATKRATAKK